MMKNLPTNHGFSLLEVVIALAIFSISIVALYSIQTMTISQNFAANRITSADTWASGQIENIITQKYTDVRDINGSGGVGVPDGVGGLGNKTTTSADGWIKSPDNVYTLLWNVAGTGAVGVPLPNTKTVRVIVTSTRAGTGNLVDLEYIKHKD